MINEATINKDQSENDNKSKKFDSLIKAYNEKGIFPFSLDNPSVLFSTKISSPFTKINNKQKLEFSSLKKDFSINNLNYTAFSGNKLPDFIYGYPHNHLLDFSEQKNFFDYQNNIKKETIMSGQKRIRQKLENEFEGILLSKKKEKQIEKEPNINLDNKNKKENYPIVLTINDQFFDILVNIYTNEVNENGNNNENKNNSENMTIKLNNNQNINKNISIEKLPNININIKNNLSYENNEQVSCICLKSKCLYDYCRCHKNGSKCNKNCRCQGCRNNFNYTNNFTKSSNKTKINNICKCKISNCFFHYCDCKRRGVLCNKDCLCFNCKNSESSKIKLKNI